MVSNATALLSLVTAALATSSGCRGDGTSGRGSTGPATAEAQRAPTGSGVVRGRVRFAGTEPAPKPWGGRGFPGCANAHSAEVQRVRVRDGNLADAFVWVKSGLPAGGYPMPAQPVRVDQKGCEFEPRVFGAMVDQPIVWGNSDPLMHNVNAGQLNRALASAGMSFVQGLEAPASPGPIVIRCDVHPWMRAYAWVLPHPYFMTTGDDGGFEFGGLVEGEVSIGVWHEVLGERDKMVRIDASNPPAIDFEMRPP